MSEMEEDGVEEERRLFYVGVTRARKKLEIFDYEAAYGEKCETAVFTRQLLGINKNAKLKARAEKASASEKSVHFLSAKKTSKKDSAMTDDQINSVLDNYKVGARINHRTYGKGVIQEIKSPICRILIDGGDIHSFDLIYCIKNGVISIDNHSE